VSEDERSYFQVRAEQEIRAAQSAGHPDAARAHYVLAGYYLDLAHNPEGGVDAACMARRARRPQDPRRRLAGGSAIA